VRVIGREGEGSPADVDGPLCENADRLGRSLSLPDVRRGDLLAVHQAGAYGFGMASNYASSLRPAEAVWDGEALRLARERERPEDLWRLERP
jgi:diaminopimelate decarboxylase